MLGFLSSAALAALLPAPEVPLPMERIVVTAASRVPQAVEDTPATVTVIERAELERSLARDIREALRYEPGIAVENGPARFGLGNIAIRGLDGNRVQMLHDGVRLPDGFRIGGFSNAARNPFGTALLSRIEIVRGPGSALYGSDALAGVLAMTTIDAHELLGPAAAAAGFADAGYASVDSSLHGTGAVAARAGAFEILAGASRSEGEERDNRGEVDALGAARTRPNPQEASATSFLLKLALPTPGGGRWRATYDRFERRVATDVLSLNPQSARTSFLAGDDRATRTRASVDGVVHALGPVDRLAVLAYTQDSVTRQDTVDVRTGTTAVCLSAPGPIDCRREVRFIFEQREAGLTAIAQATAPRQQLVYGLEWSRARVEESRDGRQVNLATGAGTNVVGTDVFPTRDFPRSRVDRLGAFVQDEIAFGAAALIPALRYDRFEMRPEADALYAAANPGRGAVALTDSAWSPKLGALVPLAGPLTLALQAAAGFRAPPYSDVNVGLSLLPLGYTVVPNPDLQPEKSRGFEAGLRGRHDRLTWSVTAYRTDYRDLIVSRAPLPCPGHPLCAASAAVTFQSQNVTRARIEGVEARLEARPAPGWTVRAGAAASRGDDRSRGAPLNSVDPPKAVVGLAWERGGTGAELHVTHVAAKRRIDESAGALYATPAFTTVDLTGRVAIGRNATLTAGIFNVGDAKHWQWSDVRGIVNPGASTDRYTQPGRSFGLQARIAF